MVSIPAQGAVALWPPDDTEESIVGVDRHQYDITSLRLGINEEAQRLAGAGPLPWQAISQIKLLGYRRHDGTTYDLSPDVSVFPHPVDTTRGSYALTQDGPPALIIEVASDSTYQGDIDLQRGKAWTYRRAGVREYLALDPTGAFIPELGRGWRLEGGRYVPWLPDDQGRWHSRSIGLAFGVEDGLAAVYAADGHRLLREREIWSTMQAQREEGVAAGAIRAKRAWLRRLVQLRFGDAPALEARIDTDDEPALDAMLDRVVRATSPDDV